MTRLEELKAKKNNQMNKTPTSTSTRLEQLKESKGISTTPITTPRVANFPRYEDQIIALQKKREEDAIAQQKETEIFKKSLPVSAVAIKLQTGNNGNKFYTGINPTEQQAKQQLQEKAYEQIKNSNAVKDLNTYAQAEKQFEKTLPETEEDKYLEYRSMAQQTEDLIEKAKYNVMAEKSKQHGDFYYGTAQTFKTLGTSIADSVVNVGQFVKNAFKSEMQKEIRDAWESIATFSSPDYKSKFKALRDVSDEQANKVAQNAINSAKQVLRKYNITVPDNVNAEYARQMIADIDEWVYKENKLEEETRTAHEKVQQENQALGPVAKTITQTADVIGGMAPTIATNAILPGAGSAPMFLSSAQSSSEQALKEGATYEQAMQRGILSGGMEVATEMIGGENLSKLTGIPTLFKKFGINTPNKLAQVLLDVGSEGLEEMVSTGVQPLIDRVTYNPNAEFATANDYWQSFKESILPTLFFVGANASINAINNYKAKAIEKVEKSNMTVEQKEQAKGEIEKGAQEMIQNVQTNTNLEETSPNTVQTEQNNVQNVQDSQKTVQMEQSLGLQQSKEIPQAIQTFIENRNNTAPGLNIQFDNTLNTDGRIIRNPDGTRMISINPNSTRAYEFVVVHEMMHDLENTQEFQELSKYVKDRAITHEEFEKAKQAITEQYTKYYTENNLDMSGLNMDVETTNDMVAQALGNQQFLNELAGQKPNVFMRLYNWIKNVAFDGNKTGKTFSERRADNKYLQELKNKFETAYNTNYKGNASNKFSIQTRSDGTKYVKVDTDQNIFDGVATKDYNKVAKMYIEDYLLGKTKLAQTDTAIIDKTSSKKYTNPGKYQSEFETKMKLTPELKNVLEIAKKEAIGLPTKANSKYSNWEYYTFDFELGGKTFTGTINIGIDSNGNKHFYEINKIHPTVQRTGSDKSVKMYSNNSIPSNNNVVNNQYMQNGSNNTQNSTQSSFSLPKKDYIRLYRGLNNKYDKNYDKSKLDNVNGYESWTDNYELAKQYGENVYYIDLPLNKIGDDIIDQDGERFLAYKNDKPVALNNIPGNEYMLYTYHDDFENIQYNETSQNINLPKTDNQGRELTKEQQERFKNSKARDKNNNLVRVYHTTGAYKLMPQFNEFDPRGDERYKFGNQIVNYYTDSKDMSGSYADQNYEMADTRRLNSIEDVNEILKELNAVDNSIQFKLDKEKLSIAVYDDQVEIIHDFLMNLREKNKDLHNKFLTAIMLSDSPSNLSEKINSDKKLETLFYTDLLHEIDSKTKNKWGYVTATNILQKLLNYDGQGGAAQIIQFKDENDLFRNLKTKLQAEAPKYVRKNHWQYSGYTDIQNPYIIDAKNKSWNKIEEGNITNQTNDIVKRIIEYNNNLFEDREGKNHTQEEILKAGGYDGIIIKNVVDYGGDADDMTPNDLYITFSSNQFKAIDNLNPTDDPDIRYTQSNNEWQNYLDKNWDLMPNAKKTKNLPTQQELRNKLPTEETRLNMKKPKLEDIAELTQEQAELPTMSYKQRADKNTPYRSKFWDNVESSKIISKDVKEQVNMTNYERKHNADVLEKMKERLDAEPMKVAQEWFRKDIKKPTDQDVALGAILMERYQAEGRFDEAVDVVEKLADMGREAGRTVQMYSIFQRLTPEGMMIYQQRKLNSALETLTQNQTGKWVEQNKDKFKLTEDDATFITAKVQEAQNAPTERQKQIALAEIETRINDKIPPEAGQLVKAFRRIAMLFNPKTQVRNIAGNITVMPLNYVTDLVATGIDKAIAKKTGVRTTALPNVKTIGKGFKKGAGETIDDYRRGIRTTPTGSRYEIQNNAKSFNENTNSKVKNAINKKMNAIDRILSTTLELGDRPFYEAAYQNALEGQMKANGVTEPTQEMIDIASNVALSQTWQDNNNYTQAVLGIRSAFNKININGFGLGDLIIPFAKTPANLTKAMVDYSPAGFIPAIINYNDMRKAISRGDMTAMQQKKFVTSVGKAMAGTILYAIAGALVKGDKITGSSDEDKDVANFEKNVLGIQPYSIKIGDKTFTYNWANPIATPFAIMADTYKMSEEGAKWNEILVNAFKVAGDQLVANSFLQGIQELLSSEYGNESAMDNLVGAIMDLPTQFTPTLFGQIATQFDSTKRQTFENGDTVGTMANEVKNKIPGLRNELAPQVNTFGEDIQNYGGANNPFNVFLNPGNVSSTNATETQKELYKLYQDTKDKTIFPAQAPYSISGGGEKVTLSSQDRAYYQKTSGQFVTKNLDALFNSEYYKSLDNDKKAEVVSEIVADANILAKGEYLETKTSKELKEKLSKLGDIPYVEYYNAWSATRGIESDKNWKGESISGSKKKKQIQAINNATSKNLTNKQRETLYGLLNVSGY